MSPGTGAQLVHGRTGVDVFGVLPGELLHGGVVLGLCLDEEPAAVVRRPTVGRGGRGGAGDEQPQRSARTG
ncbi:hypothetical protein QRN89_34400 [Streptomyces chengbuensis]|uniref:hypothetical protein n=1 Tax=Streptomyces chengbuensis TaxID=3053466 RepID=UPI0025B5E698|nr:hypothetical protein [Streptomyces sp. HUAS CB01]WJY54446.1 hypothetical protein QRN89_34400 [Streptomyces sp. HUAS CB01]